MKYITIYSTHDRTEVGILKNLFEQQNIHYRILGEATDSSAGIAGTGGIGIRVQVREEDRAKAREILEETGFQNKSKLHSTESPRKPKVSRWILIFLAALVLVIVALLITWFMNVD